MTQPHPANRSPRARWTFGINAVLIGLLALTIVVLLNWATATYLKDARADWTFGSIHSLSPRTKVLLNRAQDKGMKFHLVNFTSTDDPQQHDRINDLIESYARASDAVATLEQRDVEDTVRDIFRAETKAYEAVAADFGPMLQDVQKFLELEAANLGALAQRPDVLPHMKPQIMQLQGPLGTGLPERIAARRRSVAEQADSTDPSWAGIAATMERSTTDLVGELEGLLAARDRLVEPLQKYLSENQQRYTAIIKQLSDFNARVSALPELKRDIFRRELRAAGEGVVMLGKDSARVIPLQELYKSLPGQRPDGQPERAFAGEEAITSALLAMVEPNKVKVVYVSARPMGLVNGPYSEITSRLQKTNFDVVEWSPPGPPTPGMPPPNNEPPASGKGVVWVVFPPSGPSEQEMMMGMPPPDPSAVIEATQKHMDAGGAVLFLAEPSPPMAAFMPQSQGYAFAPLVEPLGIVVKPSYVLVRKMTLRDRGGETVTLAYPEVLVDKYPNHPITTGLDSLNTLLLGATVVEINGKSEGSQAAPILQTGQSDNEWAESAYMDPRAQFDKNEDLPSPITVAVAATTKTGGKIAVVGTRSIGLSTILQQPELIQTADGIAMVPRFPGNGEFTVNTILWLADYQNMIAVGPQANPAMRVRAMGETEQRVVRLSAFLVPPVLALAIGAVVFYLRRR